MIECRGAAMSSGKDNNIQINSIEPLKQGQSKYVNPIRIYYSENGKERTWDSLKVHDSVSIVIYNEERDKLIFVRQFRPAVYVAARLKNPENQGGTGGGGGGLLQLDESKVSGYTLEMCAGIIDKAGKSPKEIAREEILEETGYDVDLNCIEFISSHRSGVGVNGSLQHTYFASVKDSQRVTKGGGVGEEQILVVELTPQEARKILHVSDEECSESRPASMLYALSWFLYEKYATLQANSKAPTA